MGTIEKYNAPLRAVFLKLCFGNDRRTPDKTCLQLFVFHFTKTVAPEAMFPLFLVFGVIPRPARITLSLTEIELCQAVEKAMVEV